MELFLANNMQTEIYGVYCHFSRYGGCIVFLGRYLQCSLNSTLSACPRAALAALQEDP